MKQHTELAEGASLSLVGIYTQTVQDFGGEIEQIIQKGDDYLIIYTAPCSVDFMEALELYLEEDQMVNLN